MTVLTRLMEEGAAGGGAGDGPLPEERGVVIFRGSRDQARVMGSTLGPTVLAPGPEQGWQVLVLQPGAVAGDILAAAIRFATNDFGLDEPPALSLHRSGTTLRIGVPGTRSEMIARTWLDKPLSAPDSKIVEDLAHHLVAWAPEASSHDFIDVLRDERGDGTPLLDLVALLELPATVINVLAVDDNDVPDGGELLIREDKDKHARIWARAHAAERWDARIAVIEEGPWGPEAISRASSRVFGFLWIALGVVAVFLGVVGVLLGVRPERTLTGVAHPAGWVVLGVVMVWFGRLQRRHGTRKDEKRTASA